MHDPNPSKEEDSAFPFQLCFEISPSTSLNKQDQLSNRYDSILMVLDRKWLNNSHLLTDLLSYPFSKDAITSKNKKVPFPR